MIDFAAPIFFLFAVAVCASPVYLYISPMFDLDLEETTPVVAAITFVSTIVMTLTNMKVRLLSVLSLPPLQAAGSGQSCPSPIGTQATFMVFYSIFSCPSV